MYNMSAGMGETFARVAQEFTEIIRKLGPSPGRTGVDDRAAS
jgi:coenzyme F420-reducing hydrogenase delta subunit